MERVIARRSSISFILASIGCLITIVWFVYFLINYDKNDDSLFPLGIVLNAIIFFNIIIFNYKIISKPRILIVQKDDTLIIYPNSAYQSIINISDIVSVSNKLSDSYKPTSVLTINTKEKGYQILGVSNIDKVLLVLNELIEKDIR